MSSTDQVPVISQTEPKKKRKGYCVPAGILKILQTAFCVLTLVVTHVGRWEQLVTIIGFSDRTKTKETGVFKFWGWLPFGYYHAHIFAMCILGTLAGTSFLLWLAFILRMHECCGRRGLRYWMTIDLVYSVTASCLMFIAFSLLAVFCAYPEIWREHLFGALTWRNVHNVIIVIAATLAFVTMFLFIISSVIAGQAINAEMKNPKPERKRKRIVVVDSSDKI